ncbi:GGDEF domain-containing protein [Alteromonas sp. BMJM2]|uniref:GGDEF domain-containing protein n=1 Tax=Alteromonas sp. BMJM2 TaxID=2954241 RepID=UPI0022B55B99|nr:GGDEF domain-containing protein [Alteromonas sp. BMJM2]
MEDKQLQAYKKNNALLCQFIIKLSSFYEGFSDKVDGELKTLRGHLSGTPNFSLATVSINKLNASLQHQDITLRKYSLETVSSIEEAMKQLQKIIFEDEELRSLATQELIKLNQPVADIFSIYRLYSRALQLHRVALGKHVKGVLSEEPAPKETAKSTPRQAANDDLERGSAHFYRSIFIELNQLVSSYTEKKPNDIQLLDIKKRLDQGMAHEQLLESCVVVLRMIVQDAMTEASLTGKVIQGLHTSLGKIGEDVNKSIDGSKAQFEQRTASNAELKTYIDSIEEAVSTTDSFDALKTQTQSCIKALSKTLTDTQSSDSESQTALISLLSSMQDRINKLQQQTDSYKRKIAEQVMQSKTDALTRLPNRQAYNEQLAIAYQQFQSSKKPLSIALIDIDFFKSINDKFGHSAGDKTLQLVSRAFKRHMTDDQFLARWGGEEFVVLLPDTNEKQLREKLEAIRKDLESMQLKFKQERVIITVSLGGTSFTSTDTIDLAFERADKYLYQAKRNGRNQVVTDIDAQK